MTPSLERIRRAFPVTEQCTYLSTGSFGPLSKKFAATLRRSVLDELKHGRMRPERFEILHEATERTRRALAAVLNIAPTELALTRSTSASLETVIREFPFRRGDDVVCTQLEHHALTSPLAIGASRGRFTVTLAHVPENDAEDLRWLEQCVTPRTRLIAFTGVSYETGQRLPLAGIAAFARERNIATLLDGAQSVGAMPLDLAGIGIDFCAFPLQKWLCGPDGLGGLYVRSGGYADLRRDDFRNDDAHYANMRADRATQLVGVLEATADHLEWLATAVGWNFAVERTLALAARMRAAFAELPRVRVLTPEAHAGLVTVEALKGTYGATAAALARRRIVARSWPELDRYRFSTAFFNSEHEISKAVRVFR